MNIFTVHDLQSRKTCCTASFTSLHLKIVTSVRILVSVSNSILKKKLLKSQYILILTSTSVCAIVQCALKR
jgi:hypothetical protein